jgi:hypothetical protein
MRTIYFFLVVFFCACTQGAQIDLVPFNNNEPQPALLQEDPLLDIVPCVNPLINEACQTSWSNLSAIVNADGTLTYFYQLPEHSETEIAKDRFQFFYQVINPYFGQYADESQYTPLGSPTFELAGLSTYGTQLCSGLQELRIWLHDEYTGAWYFNSQVCWAGFICANDQQCDYGYNFDQIEYTNYAGGYQFLVDGPISMD